jgi:hypothetical protein
MKIKTSIALGLSLCILFAAAYLSAGETRLPGVRVLGNISDKFEPVTFDHPKHVSIAGKCDACHHHGNGNSSSCKECHALSPSAFKNSVVNSFMPCTNCHGAYDRENAAMPGLKVAYHKKCFECHRGMGDLGLNPKGCTELCHAQKAPKVSMKAKP